MKRADAERRVVNLQNRAEQLLSQDGLEYDEARELALEVPGLIAELRAAWAREDKLRADRLFLAATRGGYHRGLAAARDKLEKWREYNTRTKRFNPDEAGVALVAVAVLEKLIEALAAGAGGKEDKNG